MELPVPQAGPLPPFDPEGNLPPGDYAPTAADFEQRFVHVAGSATRERIYQGWERLRAALAGARVPPSARVLMNGSYTTSQLDPSDLDVVVAVPLTARQYAAMIDIGTHPALELLTGHDARTSFDCDAFPLIVLPDGHPHYEAVTAAGIDYWLNWFGTTPDDSPKGRVWSTAGGFA